MPKETSCVELRKKNQTELLADLKKLREDARIARQKAWAKKKKNTTSEEE